jgi:hypothetical protein
MYAAASLTPATTLPPVAGSVHAAELDRTQKLAAVTDGETSARNLATPSPQTFLALPISQIHPVGPISAVRTGTSAAGPSPFGISSAAASRRSEKAASTAHSTKSSWQSFGTDKWREKEIAVSAKRTHAATSVKARAVGDVRVLEKEMSNHAPYPAEIKAVTQIKIRPGSAGFSLPPINDAIPLSPAAIRTSASPLSPTAVIRTTTSVQQPVAGVDDPLLHANVVASATGNSIRYTSQRLHELEQSKAARHEAAMREFMNWKYQFERALHAETETICESLRTDCDGLEKPIRVLLFETMADDVKLMSMDKAAITAARASFDENYTQKDNRIANGVAQLLEIENKREAEFSSTVEKLVHTLSEVAYIPGGFPELERVLAPESKALNVHLLRNRANAVELGNVLKAELVLKQKETYSKEWEARFARWRQLRHQFYINEFLAAFNNSGLDPIEEREKEESLRSATYLKDQLDQYLATRESLDSEPYPYQYCILKRRKFDVVIDLQKEFQSWSEATIQSVLKLTPASEPIAEELSAKVAHHLREIQDTYLSYDRDLERRLAAVDRVEEQIGARLQNLVAQLRFDLSENAGAKSAEEIDAEIQASIVPLLNARAQREASARRAVEMCLRHWDSLFLKRVDAFSKFYTRACVLWGTFLSGVKTTNSNAEEALNQTRDKFEDDNADLESQLSTEVKQLGMEPSMAALDGRLAEVKALVGPDGKIEELYRSFNRVSIELARSHPPNLHACNRANSAAMAALFGLRTPAEDAAEALRLSAVALEAAREAERREEEEDAKLSKRDKVKKDKEKEQRKAQEEKEKEKKSEEERKAKLARARAAAEAAAASAEAPVGSRPSTSGRAGTPDATAKRPVSKTSKRASSKSDEDLLRELEYQESVSAALNELEKTTLNPNKTVFFSLERFVSLLRDQMEGGVKLMPPVKLEDLGKVPIQPGGDELLHPEKYSKQADTEITAALTPAELKASVVMPPPPSAVEERPKSSPRRAASRAGGATQVRSGSRSPGSTTPRGRTPTTPTAAVAIEGEPATKVPYLKLPNNVVRFSVVYHPVALAERIVNGEQHHAAPAATHAMTIHASTAVATAAAHAGGTPASPNLAGVTSPGPAVTLDSTRSVASAGSAGGELNLSMGNLETAAEAAEHAQQSEIAALEAAAASAAAAAAAATAVSESPVNSARKPGKQPKSKAAREAAAAAEAAARKAEEDRLKLELEKAEIARRLEETKRLSGAVPTDSHGLALIAPLKFPTDLLTSELPRVQQHFLLSLEVDAAESLDHAKHLNAAIELDLIKELSLALRKYRPRFNRISVDVYEVRAKQLNANLLAYNRFVERLKASWDALAASLASRLLQGEKELYKFKLGSGTVLKELVELSKNPLAELAQLHKLNTSLKQSRASLTSELTTRVFLPVEKQISEFDVQLRGKVADFIAIATRKIFGNNPDAALLQSPTRTDDAMSVRSGGGMSSIAGASDDFGSILTVSSGAGPQQAVECYNQSEVAFYGGLLEEFISGYSALLGKHGSDPLARLKSKLENLLKLEEFNLAYSVNLQNLGVQQGLGHHNGAPKRKLTVSIRSEFHRSEAQEQFIDLLISELERARDGTLQFRPAAAQAKRKAGKSTVVARLQLLDSEQRDEEKSATDGDSTIVTVASSVSSEQRSLDEDLASSFSTLSLSLRPPSAISTVSSSLTAHLLGVIDQLRLALHARATYLQALKPELRKFNLPEVITEWERHSASQKHKEQQEATERARREREAQEEEQTRGSARGKARGSSGVGAAAGTQAADKKEASSPAGSPQNTGRLSTGAAAASGGSKPNTASGGRKVTGKRAAELAAAEAAAAAAAAESAANGPSFIPLIEKAIDTCKREMHTIVAAYEEKYPERKHSEQAIEEAKAAKAAEEAGQQATEKSKSSSSLKKKKEGGSSSARGGKKKGSEDAEPVASEPAIDAATIVPPAIEAHCTAELARAQEHLAASRKKLLSQTDRAAGALADVMPVVLRDVFARYVEASLRSELQELESGFDVASSSWSRSKARHHDRLKPSLAARPDRNLTDLITSESRRFAECTEGIRLHRRRVLQTLFRNSDQFVRALAHTTETIVTLADGMVLPVDLSNVLSDGEEGGILASRKGLKHLIKESERLLQTKAHIAREVGATIDQFGNLIAAPEKTEEKEASGAKKGSTKKKSSAQLEAERVAAEKAAASAASLTQRLNPRYIEITWPGLSLEPFQLPVFDEEEKARIAAQQAEEEAAAAAAAAAAEAEAATKKKKKRTGKAEEAAAPESPSSSRPGSSSGAKAATASIAPGARKSKKKNAADSSAAPPESAQLSAANISHQTANVTGLNQPSQRAALSSRDALYNQYRRIYSEKVTNVVATCELQLAAEAKANKEFNVQIARLQNPDALQFQ